ncbi:hypothetical protein B6U93_03655 [Candidatus Woesearchaeota archaeon ex4484_78]|nr:MAG: hypothetical protein B6U93_03655 [Candidatus Woesearchaeota archaeon ex4484_78]
MWKDYLKISFYSQKANLLFFITAQLIGLFVTSRYINYKVTKQTGKLTWKELPTMLKDLMFQNHHPSYCSSCQ